jgi:hypothetical protein
MSKDEQAIEAEIQAKGLGKATSGDDEFAA